MLHVGHVSCVRKTGKNYIKSFQQPNINNTQYNYIFLLQRANGIKLDLKFRWHWLLT